MGRDGSGQGCPSLKQLLWEEPSVLFCSLPHRDLGRKEQWSLAGGQEDLFGVGQGTEGSEPQFLHLSSGGRVWYVWDVVVVAASRAFPQPGPPWDSLTQFYDQSSDFPFAVRHQGESGNETGCSPNGTILAISKCACSGPSGVFVQYPGFLCLFSLICLRGRRMVASSPGDFPLLSFGSWHTGQPSAGPLSSGSISQWVFCVLAAGLSVHGASITAPIGKAAMCVWQSWAFALGGAPHAPWLYLRLESEPEPCPGKPQKNHGAEEGVARAQGPCWCPVLVAQGP